MIHFYFKLKHIKSAENAMYLISSIALITRMVTSLGDFNYPLAPTFVKVNIIIITME